MKFRSGPELEITGYMCEDHFFEADTVRHSWQVLGEIVRANHTDGMLCEFGMPITFKGTLYNTRVWILNGQILLIRPKIYMAHGDNYRENRWFTGWN